MSKFYIVANDGEGWERVAWLRAFATEQEAEDYINDVPDGTWDSQVRVEEWSE
jgi:hypothetical protein